MSKQNRSIGVVGVKTSAASLSIAINTPVVVVGSCEAEQLILHCLYRML